MACRIDTCVIIVSHPTVDIQFRMTSMFQVKARELLSDVARQIGRFSADMLTLLPIQTGSHEKDLNTNQSAKCCDQVSIPWIQGDRFKYAAEMRTAWRHWNEDESSSTQFLSPIINVAKYKINHNF